MSGGGCSSLHARSAPAPAFAEQGRKGRKPQRCEEGLERVEGQALRIPSPYTLLTLSPYPMGSRALRSPSPITKLTLTLSPYPGPTPPHLPRGVRKGLSAWKASSVMALAVLPTTCVLRVQQTRVKWLASPLRGARPAGESQE